MKSHTLKKKEKQSGGAAAKKTYSPQELAEVFKTSRDDFTGIDLEDATLKWNPNYIFSFLKEIDNLPDIDDAIEWMIGTWEENNGLYDSFDKRISLAESHTMFIETIKSIRSSVAEWIEKKEKKAQLREKMLSGYTHNTVTIDPKQAIATEKDQTDIPKFKPSTPLAPNGDEFTDYVKLEDLPKNIRDKVNVTQKVFDVWVKQLNIDLWVTVEKWKKTRMCGCLFFLSNYYYITSRNTNAEEFDELLHYVIVDLKGKGSLAPSIRRREETIERNIKRSYLCYSLADINPRMENEIYKLRNDCKLLADGFQPILDAMKAEEGGNLEVPNQTIQSSIAL